MSRLYGRSFDAYQTSKYLKENRIKKYKSDNKRIDLSELVDSTTILDLYLPEKAIDFLTNYPIHIVKSPFIPKNLSTLPNGQNNNATIFFKGFNFKEEYKRELVFFLGTTLSVINPDKLPNEYEFPCEFGDLLPLLMEYIYLRENNKEKDFSLKHLNEVLWNGKNYIKIYDSFQRYLINDKYRNYYYSDDEEDMGYKKYKENESNFLKATLDTIVPLSSLDGVLQIIDTIKDDSEMKKLIELLFENKNNDRSEILREYNIESFGLKRLKKEIDLRRK